MTLTDSPVVGAAGSAVDRVWNALDAGGFKPESIRGDKFMALCPVHGDTHRSLSVKFDRRREAVLLNCFTCHADYRDVASAIGLSATDLFDAATAIVGYVLGAAAQNAANARSPLARRFTGETMRPDRPP